MLNIKQKLIKALKDLCFKVTGKKSIRNTIYEVLEDITKNYNGASIDYVNSLMDAAVKRLIVTELPTEDIDTNTIYMILDSQSTLPSNVYNEYMYIQSNWELIGTTQITVYTAGDNVSIVDGVISATDTTYTAGTGISIEDGVISASGGGTKHHHFIRMFKSVAQSSGSVGGDIYLHLETESDTPFTWATLVEYLSNYKNIYFNASGHYDSYNISTSTINRKVVSNLGANGSGTPTALVWPLEYNNNASYNGMYEPTTFTDTVV